MTVTGTKTGYTTAARPGGHRRRRRRDADRADPDHHRHRQGRRDPHRQPRTWGPAPVTLTYQWKANGAAISGATATTYIVPAAYVGKTITVTVTGTKTGYTTVAKTSAPTARWSPERSPARPRPSPARPRSATP